MDTQADQVKQTRLELAKLCEATDSEIVGAALIFADWAITLRTDENAKPVVRCTEVSNE